MISIIRLIFTPIRHTDTYMHASHTAEIKTLEYLCSKRILHIQRHAYINLIVLFFIGLCQQFDKIDKKNHFFETFFCLVLFKEFFTVIAKTLKKTKIHADTFTLVVYIDAYIDACYICVAFTPPLSKFIQLIIFYSFAFFLLPSF